MAGHKIRKALKEKIFIAVHCTEIANTFIIKGKKKQYKGDEKAREVYRGTFEKLKIWVESKEGEVFVIEDDLSSLGGRVVFKIFPDDLSSVIERIVKGEWRDYE